MDAILALQSLGLTATEARLYAALRRHGPLTGYEAAQRSGLARANAYAALERMVGRGTVRAVPAPRARKFEAVPVREFAESRVRQMRDAVHRVERTLERPRIASRVTVGEGVGALDQAAHAIVAGARESVHLIVGPEAAGRLGPAVYDARGRLDDVQTACLADCPAPCPVCGSGARSLPGGPWTAGLVLCRDRQEVLVADEAGGEASYVIVWSLLLGASVAAAIEAAPPLRP